MPPNGVPLVREFVTVGLWTVNPNGILSSGAFFSDKTLPPVLVVSGACSDIQKVSTYLGSLAGLVSYKGGLFTAVPSFAPQGFPTGNYGSENFVYNLVWQD